MDVGNFQTIPKDPDANIDWREKLRVAASKSAGLREDIMRACADDPLYWFAATCWLHEPRPKKGQMRVFPFIPWIHQLPLIASLHENLGYEDIGITKSRGEGASWIAILLALHEWLFAEEPGSIGVVSKDLEAADTPDDLNSLLPKAEWQLKQLPVWMAGKPDKDYTRSRSKHYLRNHRNDFIIKAYSATGDVASGGRCSWFLLDELAKFPRGPDADAMASTQHVTNSRLIISTPKGTSGAYYDVMHEPSGMVRLELDWKDNPSKNRGLYKWFKGRAIPVSKRNPLPSHYSPVSQEVADLWSRLLRKGFTLEGTIRSPWYDKECDRPGATPQLIAQELDRSFGGSQHRIFGDEFHAIAENTVKAPYLTGAITVDHETCEDLMFDIIEGGPFQMWCSLDAQGNPPPSRYVIGVDIASGTAGTYVSNSVIQVLDMITQEQVVEYTSNSTPPEKWAEQAVAIAKWFHGAFLAWEHNGPGAAATKRILEIGYGNIYRRENMYRKRGKYTENAGFYTSRETRETMFAKMDMGVRTNKWVVRSKSLLREFGQYIRVDGKICHVKYSDGDDSQSHGDRVMAFGVAVMGALQRPLDRGVDKEDAKRNAEPPPNTLAARVAQWEKEDAADADDWDHTTLADMTRI